MANGSCRNPNRTNIFHKVGKLFKKKPGATQGSLINIFGRNKPKKSKKNNNNQLGLIASPRYLNFEDHYSKQSLKKFYKQKKK